MQRDQPRGGVRPVLLAGALFVALGVLTGTALFTFNYAQGASYFSDHPSACLNCHVMRAQYDAWSHSSHARVATCNDCHTPHDYPEKLLIKGLNGFNHSVAFTLGGFHEPIRINDLNASVVQHNCVSCHRTIVSTVNLLHSTEPLLCVSCHSNVGHRTRD